MKISSITKFNKFVAPILIFVVLLFSCPFSVQAATDGSGDYPLPYAPGQIPNYVITSSELSTLQSVFDDSSYSVDLYNDYVIIFKGQGLTSSYGFDNPVPLYTVYVFSSPLLLNSNFSTNNSFVNFNLFTGDYIDVLLSNYQRFNVAHQNGTGAYLNGQFSIDVLQNTEDTYHRFYGDVQVNNVSNQYFTFSYINQYPYYCHGDFETLDRNQLRGIFLTSNLQTIAVDPQPVDPDFPNDPDPTLPTPVIPSKPSTLTIESLLEWIGDVLVYFIRYFKLFVLDQFFKPFLSRILESIITGFTNLYDNIVSFFRPYFVLFNLKFDEIINSIKVFFTSCLSLITDIKIFLSDISDKITHITNVVSNLLRSVRTFFDSIIDLGTSNGSFSLVTLSVNLFIPSESDFNTLFENSDTFNLIGIANTIFTKIFSIWDSIYNLSSSKVLHVPSYTYHGQQIGGYDIDFSWFDTYKIYTDGIISAFLVFSYLWFLFFRLPSFLRGQAQLGVHAVSVTNSSSKGGNEN